MKLVALGLLAILPLAGLPQSDRSGLVKPKNHVAQEVEGYVTQPEAKAIMARAEKLLRKLTKSSVEVKPIALGTSGVVSREQVVLQLDRLYEIVRPKVKLSPRAVVVNAAVLKMNGEAKTKLARLVKLGAVGNYGPLAAGPTDKLTVRDFGDTMGFFLARMAQMTHLPSRKWSPPLMDDGG